MADPAAAPAPPSSSPAGLTASLPHVAIVVVALVGLVVLSALGKLPAEPVVGLLGVAIGGSGTVAAANLTPSR